MISFSTGEIMISVGYAILWGIVFSAAYALCILLVGLMRSLPKIVRDIFVFDKILPTPSFASYLSIGKRGAFFSFASVVIFTVGFNIISYFSLDGVIRIYMLIISSAAFYVSKIVLFDILSKLLLWLISALLMMLCVVFRLLVTPLKWLFSFLINNIKRAK